MIYSNKNYKYDTMDRTGHRYAALLTTLIHCSTNRRPLCGQTGNLIPACCINQIKKKLTLEKQPHSGDLFVAPGNISDQKQPHSGDLFVAPGNISDQMQPHSGDLNISENGKHI